jgi:Ca2+-binding RTX toxin-like protein
MATYYGDENDNVISGSASADQIYGYGGNDYLLGGDGDDYLSGGDGGDSLSGGAGNDTLDGGNGADILAGGAGDDTYIVDNVSDIVAESSGGNEGIDTVQSSVTFSLSSLGYFENLTLTGTAAINGTGNGLDNILTGNSAANLLDGGAGADTLAGGDGNDTYVVDDASDAVTETNADTAQIDTVQSAVSYTLGANLENLVLTGTAALDGTGNSLANTITGNGAANGLDGGLGNDWLDGGAGADTLYGGAGNDTYGVDDTGDNVTEYFNEGTDTVQSSVTYTLAAYVENLTLNEGAGAINGTGNDLNNILTGNSADNVLDGGAFSDDLYGGDGNDFLYGGTGWDVLVGGNGNDFLDSGTGLDYIIGGAGNDTIVLNNASNPIMESTGQGIDTVLSSVESHTLTYNVENLTLNEGTAALNGTGNELNNILIGNSAANLLDGGAGVDTLAGGDGADIFAFGTLTGGADTVTDFASGTEELRFSQATLPIGDGDTSVEDAVSLAGPDGFATGAELVIITSNASALDATSAAAAIGSASGAYTAGDTRLFAVDNGTDSALYRFQAADADAAVEANELTLIVTLQGTAQTALADYAFA